MARVNNSTATGRKNARNKGNNLELRRKAHTERRTAMLLLQTRNSEQAHCEQRIVIARHRRARQRLAAERVPSMAPR